jgi:hypothetical protein
MVILARQMELARKRGDRRRACQLAIDVVLTPTYSSPIDFASFLDRDARSQPVLDWAVSTGIDIRVTQPGALMEPYGQYGCHISDGKRHLILLDPTKEYIEAPGEFIDTLFHEAIHSTGPFLNRNELPLYLEDGLPYYEEEYIATAGAAYLRRRLGINEYEARELSLDTWAAYFAVVLDCSPSSVKVDSIFRGAAPKIRCAVDFILRGGLTYRAKLPQN